MWGQTFGHDGMSTLIPMAIVGEDVLSGCERFADGIRDLCPVVDIVMLGNACKGTVVRFFLFTTKRMDRDGPYSCPNLSHQFIGRLDGSGKPWMREALAFDRPFYGFSYRACP